MRNLLPDKSDGEFLIALSKCFKPAPPFYDTFVLAKTISLSGENEARLYALGLWLKNNCADFQKEGDDGK